MPERGDSENQQRYCANCGSHLRLGNRYCVRCGKQIESGPLFSQQIDLGRVAGQAASAFGSLKAKIYTLVRSTVSRTPSDHFLWNILQDFLRWLRGLSATHQVGLVLVALVSLILFPRFVLMASTLILVTSAAALLILQRYGGEVVKNFSSSSPTTPPPPSPVHAEEQNMLQRDIDEAAPGTTLRLGSDEYEGPITVDKPLKLQGKSGVIWARWGPVLTVSSPEVRLEELSLEVTALDGGGGDEEADVALKLVGRSEVDFENVSVRGRVVGLGEEDGEWRLPSALDLGVFAPHDKNRFVVGLAVPVGCQLESEVAGLDVEPNTLEPGEHDVTLTVRDIPAGTLIFGRIKVRSALVTRSITVMGGTVNSLGRSPAHDVRLWG